MSKNLTRKGLAFGALIALGSTVIAGAPAFAANELNVAPVSGSQTQYGSIIGDTFSVAATVNTGFDQAAISKLTWKVENASKVGLDSSFDVSLVNSAGTRTDGTPAVTDVAADNATYYVVPGSTSQSSRNVLEVTGAANASTYSVVVTAFIDANLNGVLDAGNSNEWSTSQTITFNKAADVVWTTEFTAPQIDDTKFTAYVSAAPSINMGELGATKVLFSETTTSTSGTPDTTELITATYDSTTGKAKANGTFSFDFDGAGSGAAVTKVLATKRYTAQASYHASTADATTLVGSAVAQYVAAATVSTVSAPKTTATADIYGTDTETTTDADFAYNVRSAVTSVPFEVTLKDSDAKVLSGVAAKVYVVETANSSLKALGKVTVGGKELTDATSGSADSVNYDATSDANGKITGTLALSGLEAGNAVKVYVVAQGVNTTPTAYTVYTLADTDEGSISLLSVSGDDVLYAAKGSTASLKFAVVDNFGQLMTSSKHRVALSFDKDDDGTSFEASGDTNVYSATVSGGYVTMEFAIPSDQADSGSDGIEVEWFVQQANTQGAFQDTSATDTLELRLGAANAVTDFSVTADLADDSSANDTLSTTATNTIALSTGARVATFDTTAIVAADERIGGVATVSANTGIALGGSLTDSTSASTAGAVTFSSPELYFVVTNQAGQRAVVKGSATVQSAVAGTFTGVVATANKAGKHTLTVTAGSKTKTYVIDFGSADDNDGAAVTLSAPQTIKAGRTLVITGTVADKFGNGINTTSTAATANDEATELLGDLSVTYEGPGLIVGSLPTETDATGKFTFRVLLGADDAGLATVTASYDRNGDADYADLTGDTPDIVKSANVLVGVSATVSAGSKKANVVVKNAAGLSVKVVSGSKVATKTATSDSYKLSLSKLTSGSKTVKVYVNDILVTSKKVTVRR